MKGDVIKVLEVLCEASDDCVYSELRGTSKEVEASRKEFDRVWDESVSALSQATIADYLEANETMLTKTKAKVVTIESLKKFAGID